MSLGSTPRIMQQHLEQFIGRIVRIVGRVQQLHGDTALVDAGGLITVHLNPEAHIRYGSAAEVVGRVRDDLSLQSMQAVDFGDNFDYAAANAVVEVGFKLPHVFHEADEMPAVKLRSDVGKLSCPTEPQNLTELNDNVRSDFQPMQLDLPNSTTSFNVSFDDAQLLINEIEEFELSQQLEETDLEVFDDGIDDADLENICVQHLACTLRHEQAGEDHFEVHELDGEELWLYSSKPPREKRRKSYV